MSHRPAPALTIADLVNCKCGCRHNLDASPVQESLIVPILDTAASAGAVARADHVHDASPWKTLDLERLSQASERIEAFEGIVGSVAERVDELLDRSEIMNAKVAAFIEESRSEPLEDRPLYPPGTRVWSQSTRDGPFMVVANVITDVAAEPVHGAGRSGFSGVEACVVRAENGRYYTLPTGDLGTVQPARQKLPKRIYAVCLAAAVAASLAGQAISFFLMR